MMPIQGTHSSSSSVGIHVLTCPFGRGERCGFCIMVKLTQESLQAKEKRLCQVLTKLFVIHSVHFTRAISPELSKQLSSVTRETEYVPMQ